LLAAVIAPVPAMGTPAPAGLTAAIPPRAAMALTGSELIPRLAALDATARDEAIASQILQGNVPSFLRQLRPVEMVLRDPGRAPVKALIWVMPDYLAVGSDQDFVRVPLGLGSALAVARGFGFTLPTRKMVDSIYRQAELKLAPLPLPAGPCMTSVDTFRKHNRMIDQQLVGQSRGALVAGDKKDLVLTPRLRAQPGRVAIYGWHRPDGGPIQPLSCVHGERYADYSHGIRLVSGVAYVDGQPRSIFDLLEHPDLSRLLSDEGPNREARKLAAAPRAELHAEFAR
jgi:hypothetical protein